ncbi:MAG: protein DA1 [Candidatus Latescibacteria bacterium]|nr:protein DA1 [Candidatus Latescibacterota bacterium]NIO57330.1 protein DA1 [Candidatus Latescibacterota bacterium]
MRWPVIAVLCLLLFLHPSVPPVQAQDTSACAACGEKLSGDFVEIEGQYYHSNCFTCDYCNKPIPDSFTRYEGKNYHTSCFEDHIALRCDVCGGIIKGKYISNFWGNAYHPEHEGVEVQCSFCRRFIVGKLVEKSIVFQDGRHLCGICTSTAVFESAEAKLLLMEVAERLADFGLKVDPRSIEVNLVGNDALRRLAAGASQDARGFVDYEVARTMSGDVTHRATRMYLLYGMPRTEMIGTIAHELTHVWLFLQEEKDRDNVLAEGSCNFSAYLVLQETGTDQAKFIIDSMQNNPDAAYGEGFRRIKRYVEHNGLGGWLRLMKAPRQKASF